MLLIMVTQIRSHVSVASLLVRLHGSQDRVDRLIGRLHGSLLGSLLGSPGCHLVGIASQTASQATSAPSTAPCLRGSQEEGWTRQRQRIRCWPRGHSQRSRGRRGSLGSWPRGLGSWSRGRGSWPRGHSRHGRQGRMTGREAGRVLVTGSQTGSLCQNGCGV